MSAPHRRLAGPGRVLPILLAGVLAVGLSGCRTASYYLQAVRGQYEILARQRPIAKVAADPQTAPDLRTNLALVLELRDFAEKELRLPANGHYLDYADLGRPYVVWNIHAAPEFSLEPKTWWYPVVGRLKYQGYFTERGARRYAAALERRGFDVHVEGVEAYSTLGWFRDPVLNTFIHQPEAELAEIIFHELAHQRVFASGDTDFNEAFATAVAEEGVRRWLQAARKSGALERYGTALRRQQQFAQLIAETRAELKQVFGEARAGERPSPAISRVDKHSPEDVRAGKRRAIRRLRERYQLLKKDWQGYAGYDAWFAQPLNNAQLNTVATYHDLVPGFERLLQDCGGDLAQLYRAARTLAKTPKAERRRRLGPKTED